jgi:hypothetical protein
VLVPPVPVATLLFRPPTNLHFLEVYNQVSTYHNRFCALQYHTPNAHCWKKQGSHSRLRHRTPTEILEISFRAPPCTKLLKRRCRSSPAHSLLSEEYSYNTPACLCCGFRHCFHPFKAGGILSSSHRNNTLLLSAPTTLKFIQKPLMLSSCLLSASLVQYHPESIPPLLSTETKIGRKHTTMTNSAFFPFSHNISCTILTIIAIWRKKIQYNL